MRSPLLLTVRRWIYRRWNTLAIFALATLVMSAAALGPCYSRAVQQTSVHRTFVTAAVTQSGMSVAITAGTPASSVAVTGPEGHLFAPPIAETEQHSTFSQDGRTFDTNLTNRAGQCTHLRMVAGRCPDGGAMVAVSSSTARAVGLRLGERVALNVQGAPAADTAVTIVGIYQPIDAADPYWFGRSYLSSSAGLSVQGEGDGAANAKNVIDAFFAGALYVDTVAQFAQSQVARTGVGDPPLVQADIALLVDRVTLGDLPSLAAAVTQVGVASGGPNNVTTAIPTLLTELHDGFQQAGAVERVLTVQLVALALIAFAVVVAAGAGQRGREFALARLRGLSLVRTARQFLVEVAGVVLVAFVPALLTTIGLTTIASHLWLGAAGRPELLTPVVLAAVAAGVITLITTAVIGWRAARRPISELLREVPPIRPVIGIGALEAALATGTAAGLYLAFSGNGSAGNGVSLLTPMLVAALAGLLLGRSAVHAGRLVAARAWRRRACTIGLAATAVARRRGYRLAVVVLSITAALVTFAGQQAAVAIANRSARAAAETGSAVVLDVIAPGVPSVLGALRSSDPAGHYATLVATSSADVGQVPVVAVDSRSFARVASWGRDSLRPSAAQFAALRPPVAAPSITFTGTELTLRLSDLRRQVVGGLTDPSLRQGLGPIFLAVTLRRLVGGSTSALFGPLPASATSLSLRSEVDCAHGCNLRGMGLRRDALDANQVSISARIDGVTTDTSSRLTPLGRAAQWASTTPRQPLNGVEGTTRFQLADAGGGLQLNTVDLGSTASAQYLDAPIAAPALYVGAVPPSTDDLGYQIEPGLDGSPLRVRRAGAIGFVPRFGTPAIVVDISTAAAGVVQVLADTQVWLATDDPGREAALTQSLSAHGVRIVHRYAAANLRAAYDHAPPALGAYLTVAVATLSALIGLALLVLTVASSWRSRVRDRDALRLIGIASRTLRRAVLVELLVVVLTSSVVGALIGVAGARLILPKLPLFSRGPSVPIPVHVGVEWFWFLALTAGLLGVLAALAVAIAQRVATARSSLLGGVQ